MGKWIAGFALFALIAQGPLPADTAGTATDEKTTSAGLTELAVANDRLRKGQGITLLLRVNLDGRVELLRIAGSAKTQKPSLGSSDVSLKRHTGPDGPMEEIVVTVHDRRGRLLATHSFPVRRTQFVDELVGTERPRTTGSVVASSSTEMLIRVPYPKKASFLFLSRVVAESAERHDSSAPARAEGPAGWSVRESRKTVDGAERVVRYELLSAIPLEKKSRRVRLELPLDFPGIPEPLEIDPQILKFILGEIKTLEELSGWVRKPVSLFGGEDGSDAGADSTCGDGSGAWYGDGTMIDHRFNVVITGDGYTANELCPDATCQCCLEGTCECCDYMDRVCRVKAALTAPWVHPFTGQAENTPFSIFRDKMNIYRIDRASEISGVDHCPNTCIRDTCGKCPDDANPECPGCLTPPTTPDLKDTAYEVTGNAHGFGRCTNFTSDLALLHDAACQVIDPAEVDLYVVLVNCDRVGAKVDFGARVVYLSAWGRDPACGPVKAHPFDLNFVPLILHELGHAVSHLGEESIVGAYSCETVGQSDCQPNCASDFPNVATQAQVDAGSPPWVLLVGPGDFQGGNLYVEAYSHPANTDCDSSTTGKLGAFWGSTFVDPSIGNVDDPDCGGSAYNECVTLNFSECDARGQGFYRPMAKCKMRNVWSPYCRVCDCELWNTLADITQTPRSQRAQCNPTALDAPMNLERH